MNGTTSINPVRLMPERYIEVRLIGEQDYQKIERRWRFLVTRIAPQRC